MLEETLLETKIMSFASKNRYNQIAQAIYAANKWQYDNEQVPPPYNISPARWKAMVRYIITKGTPR